MKIPKPSDRETTWSKWIAGQKGGRAEVVTFCGSRCDVVTNTHAYEVEWLHKYKEAPGQALLYASLLNKNPGIILLSSGTPSDKIYFLRSVIICQKADIYLEVIDTEDPYGTGDSKVVRQLWH